MKRDTYYPIILSSWAKKGNTIEVYGIKDTISIEGLTTKAMSLLCTLCNGHKSLTDVTEKLNDFWDNESVTELLNFMIKNDLIINARNISSFTQHFINNPLKFSPNVSPTAIKKISVAAKKHSFSVQRDSTYNLPITVPKASLIERLLDTKRSCRSYTGEGINSNVLSSILWSAYGIQSNQNIKNALYHRTVPSAGGLFPLYLSLILMQDCEGIKKGVYSVGFTLDGIKLSKVQTEISSYFISFAQPDILKDAAGIVVIQGNYMYNAVKYGNRSLLYVPIEAGHVAQNIHLICQHNSLQTLEIGGFREDCLSKFTCSKKGFTPLLAVAFGHSKSQTISLPKKQIEVVIRHATAALTLKLPYNIIYGRVEGSEDVWSSGKDIDITLATKKLISEITEWNLWKEQKGIKKATLQEVGKTKFVDPCSIVKYHQKQYEDHSFELAPLNKTTVYQWVEAQNISGKREKAFILAESVLFPYQPSYLRYTYSTSSGCAAHTIKDLAVTNAVYELIERDAFMIMWMNRLKTPEVLFSSLPTFIQRRIKVIKDLGFEVVVRDISMDLAPVLMVCVKSLTSDFLCCGTASSHVLTECLHSALIEVETSLLYYLDGTKEKSKVQYKTVKIASDHAKLYLQKKSVGRAEFLFCNEKKTTLQKVGESFNDLVLRGVGIVETLSNQQFDIFIIDATNWESDFFIPEHRYVVRAIIPGLVPLTFGYNHEPFGMDRVFKVPVNLGFIPMERKYSEMNHFPHPLD